MNLPKAYNTRADEMWGHISKHVDFSDKSVIDVGCGRGDIMMRAWLEGARAVFGIDNSQIELTEARLRSQALVRDGAKIYFMRKNIEHWSEKWPGYHDIAICTSVLPYLTDPDKILKHMARDSGIVIIECQYAGDGPGFEHIETDDAMAAWLSRYWKSLTIIGSTVVKSRLATRTIWKCE